MHCTAFYMRNASVILKGTRQHPETLLTNCVSLSRRDWSLILERYNVPVLFSGILESPNNPLINVDDNVLIASNMAH